MYLLLETVRQGSLVNMALEKLLRLIENRDQKKQQLYEEKL